MSHRLAGRSTAINELPALDAERSKRLLRLYTHFVLEDITMVHDEYETDVRVAFMVGLRVRIKFRS